MRCFSQLTRERNNVFYSIYFHGNEENCLQSPFQKLNCGLTSSSVTTTTNAGPGDGFPAHELCRENLPPCRAGGPSYELRLAWWLNELVAFTSTTFEGPKTNWPASGQEMKQSGSSRTQGMSPLIHLESVKSVPLPPQRLLDNIHQ